MRAALVGLLVVIGCGGSSAPAPSIAGCWNYEMRNTAGAVAGTGALHITDKGGDFSLVSALPLPAAGQVLASEEPNGNVVVEMFTASRHVFEVQIAKIVPPLTGSAIAYAPAETVLAFTASACP